MRFGVSVNLNWSCFSCVLLERIIGFNLVFGVKRPATRFGTILGSFERLIEDTYLLGPRENPFLYVSKTPI